MRRLRGQLLGLKEASTTASQPFCSAHLWKGATLSPFTELQSLQRATVDVVVTVEEVTHLRAQEAAQAAEAARARIHAETSMKTKDMFFAMMSHEMRCVRVCSHLLW